MNNKAFSLIELMVVIAIVAVLAAVAVPAYKNYIFTAKMSPILNFGDVLAAKISQYYDFNGRHSTDLADYGYITVDNPSSDVNAVAPNITILTDESNPILPVACPTRQFIIGFSGIDGDKQLPDILGGSSTTYGHAGNIIYYVYINAAGVHKKYCNYNIFEDGVNYAADEKIGECYNYVTAGSSGSDSEAAYLDFITEVEAC